LENVSYRQAVAALTTMAQVFLVPVDEATVLVARDDAGERQRLERQLEETIYLPGATAEQINEMVQVLKSIFNIKQINPQLALGAIVVRAPETVLAPMNRTLEGLMDASGEVVVEVRLYEVDTSKMLNAGANVPNQLGVYNVDQAAAQLVSQNSALVQQAIAQGLISATASNFEIAAALIGSGLVKSSLLNSTIGIFGGGITQTGITETGSIAINLGLNSSDTRALDDVQLRVGDREPAKFREGTRFPVTTSTYTTGGISGAASALGNLGNASINGVSLASLLSQFTGSGSATIPQVSYEDLGVTLEATPTILKSGRINMLLRLKIEALSGSSVNGIPVLQSREFDSNLTVAEGQSAMMASHVSNSEVAAMTGAPGLSELPGFQLPENVNTNRQTMQLVVVVTPHVVRRRSDILAGPRMLVPADLASQ
jgi:Flp pilus assembly secretin CpaC